MPQQDDASIRIASLIDGLPVRGILLRVPILCALLMLTEGMDAFGVGFVGPYISKQHGISAEQLALVYTGTVVASLLGATMIAPLSDRFGRRIVLIATSVMMAPATILTPTASSVATLFALRFVIGLAFGAALPCAISLAADYAPIRRRSTLLLMMNTGINVGMMVAGIGAALIVPTLGWQALIYASGILSTIVTVVAWFLSPKSLQFLARRDPFDSQATRVVARLAPLAMAGGGIRLQPEPLSARAGSPLALLQDRRALRTGVLWFLMSLGYVLVNFNSYWLPTVVLSAGADIRQTGFLLSLGGFGGVAGAFGVGWIADRKGLPRILTLCLVATAIAILFTGHLVALPVMAAAFLVFVGFLLNPITGGMQALTVEGYPPELRAVATGWVSGFARLIGGGVGTMAGGFMVQRGWNTGAIANSLAAAPVAAALIVLLLQRLDRPSAAATVLVPERA